MSKSGDIRKNRVKAEPRKHYVADFETVTRADDCRVWCWGIVEVDDPQLEKVKVGLDLDSFMESITDCNRLVWFHNLGFDGSFILDWLFINGFKHTTEDNLIAGEFSTLIDKYTKIYTITVKFKSGNTTEFRDSYKKLVMSVRAIAHTYNLDISKGDIDYHAFRPIGYEPTEEEWDYLRRDVSIVGQALKILLDNGMTRLTAASDALQDYKGSISAAQFAQYFPVISLEMDKDIREAYRGGFTYAAPQFKQRHTGPGMTLDYNSMYPSVMRNELLPWGEPVWDRNTPETDEEYPLAIYFLTISGKLKPNHIPCVQLTVGNGRMRLPEYVSEFECEEIAVTNIDLALYEEHYDLDIISYNGGYKFKAMRGLFDTFIDKWAKVKAESKGGMRAIAKLQLNSLYGKFGSNPDITPKIPIYENGQVKFIEGMQEMRDPIYTAMAVFITSYARDVMIREAQKNYDIFAYCDTDSQHLLCVEIPAFYSKIKEKKSYVRISDSREIQLDVHPNNLGAWKHEYNFIDAMFVRAKCYMEKVEEDNIHDEDCEENCEMKHNFRTAIAGLNVNIAARLDFDAFYDGNVIEGKLQSKRVPGGIILAETTFTIKMED
jgi:hypothetical protein